VNNIRFVEEIMAAYNRSRSARLEHDRRLDARGSAGKRGALDHLGDAAIERDDTRGRIWPRGGHLAGLVDFDCPADAGVAPLTSTVKLASASAIRMPPRYAQASVTRNRHRRGTGAPRAKLLTAAL